MPSNRIPFAALLVGGVPFVHICPRQRMPVLLTAQRLKYRTEVRQRESLRLAIRAE